MAKSDTIQIFSRDEMWRRHAALKDAPNEARTALHDEYFGAYVEAFNIQPPNALIAASERAWRSGDRWFNSPYVPLALWDRYSTKHYLGLIKTLRENGEGWSPSVNTCLLKAAMRRLMIERGIPFGEG